MIIRTLHASDLPRRRRSRAGIVLGVLIMAGINYLAFVGLAHADGALDRIHDDPVRHELAARGGLRPWQVDLVALHFPADQVATAIAVMSCESKGNPNARGYLGEQGLMQLRPEYHQWRTWKLYGEWRSLYEPEVNVAVAADLWEEQGWRPWSCAR